MKIYDTQVDKYGWPKEIRDYLIDTHFSGGGYKWEIKLEMKIWNLIARVVNLFK